MKQFSDAGEQGSINDDRWTERSAEFLAGFKRKHLIEPAWGYNGRGRKKKVLTLAAT
ncbi:MAG: hypothetical protein WBD22_08905 [Pyrinomonadaceae bacterium]